MQGYVANCPDDWVESGSRLSRYRLMNVRTEVMCG
jgi:hypothetical protein